METSNHTPVFRHSTTPSLLLLFDIDGTLLSVRRAGRRAFSRALEEVFGWEDSLDYITFAGTTDSLVLEEVFRRHNYTPTSADFDRIFQAMPRHLERKLKEVGSDALPGVLSLLTTLSQHDDVLLGLVTGNIRACAFLKLRYAGLDAFFSEGGFGDDHPERTELARLAATRINGSSTRNVLVGDSPSDIQAARENGMLAVGVATGIFDASTLKEAGADMIFEDLSNTEEVMHLLMML